MKKLLFLLLTTCTVQLFSAAGGGSAAGGEYDYLREITDEELTGLIDLQQESIERAQRTLESSQEALERAQTTLEYAQRNYRAAVAKLQEKTEAPARMVDEQAHRAFERLPRRDQDLIEPEIGQNIFIKAIDGTIRSIKVDEEMNVNDVLMMLQNKYPELRGRNNMRFIARGELMPRHRLILSFRPQELELIHLVWSRRVEAPEQE